MKSCLRALDVIEYFTGHAVPARTIDISEALGIPNSSADEILRTLAASGYLSYNRVTKRYAPSYRLVATVRGIEHGFFGGDCIHDLLTDLRVETGATVYLTLQNDCWVQSVAEIRGSWLAPRAEPDYPTEVIRYDHDRWRPGTNFAAAMLAQKSNVEIMELATRAQQMGLGPKGPALMKSLVDHVARTRAQGFAMCRRGDYAPVDSMAVPLHIPHAVTPYAVGVVGDTLFTGDGDVKRMASAMRGVIARHSEALHRMPARSAAGIH
ncbi:helix-turn-helix domain-containing protein [Sphingomonas jatrophae]|uniref:helix-turn-helix domain-containing protein n=1 Tax=Sphingomonas jatrophae TaxID=1166337 RepID=UPI0013F4E1E4|nr:helix-turn-helix domain-containing protein [Sphingomonas jatrophae]